MKALRLFEALSSRDLHWLGKFVASPVHNLHPEVQQLYVYFRRNAGKNKEALFNPAVLSQHLYGNAGQDVAKLRHALHYFQRTIEDFLAWQEWSGDPASREFYLLQALQRRKLDEQGRSCLERLRSSNEAQPLRNASFCRTTYKMLYEAHQLDMQKEQFDPEGLQAMSDWHDAAFITEKLQNACILVSGQRVRQQVFDSGMLQTVLQYIEQKPKLLELPSIAVYYYGYLTLTKPESEQHFQALRTHLAQAKSRFTTTELHDIHLLAINFCIYQINRRKEQYLREVFELYKSGLESGVFIEKGQLLRFTYTNIAGTALRLGEFDWAYQFIEEHRDFLPEAQRHGTYSFNLARLFSSKGDYDRAMPLLQQMDFDDPLLNLQAKMMLLKMYYETDADSALDSLLTSLDAYLRRKKLLGEQQQQAHRNTLRFVRRLCALSKRDIAGRAALKKEMEETDVVAMKEWLLEMAARKN